MHTLKYIKINYSVSVSHAENIHRHKKKIELWHIFGPITNNDLSRCTCFHEQVCLIMRTWNWIYQWTMWKTTPYRRGLVLQAGSNPCRIRKFFRTIAHCLGIMVRKRNASINIYSINIMTHIVKLQMHIHNLPICLKND